jgi:hypothetical protein
VRCRCILRMLVCVCLCCTVLLHTPLDSLVKMAQSRGDHDQRPLTGILQDYADLFQYSPHAAQPSLDDLSQADLMHFLSQDATQRKISVVNNLGLRLCRRMHIPVGTLGQLSQVKVPITPRHTYDLIVQNQYDPTGRHGRRMWATFSQWYHAIS